MSHAGQRSIMALCHSLPHSLCAQPTTTTATPGRANPHRAGGYCCWCPVGLPALASVVPRVHHVAAHLLLLLVSCGVSVGDLGGATAEARAPRVGHDLHAGRPGTDARYRWASRLGLACEQSAAPRAWVTAAWVPSVHDGARSGSVAAWPRCCSVLPHGQRPPHRCHTRRVPPATHELAQLRSHREGGELYGCGGGSANSTGAFPSANSHRHPIHFSHHLLRTVR